MTVFIIKCVFLSLFISTLRILCFNSVSQQCVKPKGQLLFIKAKNKQSTVSCVFRSHVYRWHSVLPWIIRLVIMLQFCESVFVRNGLCPFQSECFADLKSSSAFWTDLLFLLSSVLVAFISLFGWPMGLLFDAWLGKLPLLFIWEILYSDSQIYPSNVDLNHFQEVASVSDTY